MSVSKLLITYFIESRLAHARHLHLQRNALGDPARWVLHLVLQTNPSGAAPRPLRRVPNLVPTRPSAPLAGQGCGRRSSDRLVGLRRRCQGSSS